MCRIRLVGHRELAFARDLAAKDIRSHILRIYDMIQDAEMRTSVLERDARRTAARDMERTIDRRIGKRAADRRLEVRHTFVGGCVNRGNRGRIRMRDGLQHGCGVEALGLRFDVHRG